MSVKTALSFLLLTQLSAQEVFTHRVNEQQLQFSDEFSKYFKEELALKGVSGKKKEEARVKIQANYLGDGAWELVFAFPEPILVVNQKIENGDLYLEFNQSVDSSDFPKIQEKLAFILNQFSTGAHSIYFSAARPVTYQTDVTDHQLIIDILPNYEAKMTPTDDEQVAHSRFLVEKRRYAAALSNLDCLSKSFSNQEDLELLRSSVYGLRSQWKWEANVLNDLQRQHPYDDDLRRLICDTVGPHSTFILAERQLQDTYQTAAVQINRAQSEVILWNTPENTFFLGSEYQEWRGHVGSITNSQGVPVGFLGTRQQGTLYCRSEWERGERLSGFLYVQEQAVFGAGTEAVFIWPLIQGDFSVRADWHRPCWEVFEALAFHGRQDRIYLNLDGVYNRYINWRAGGGARRVGITDVVDGYTSLLGSAEIFWNWVIGNPEISLSYAYDAEYVIRLKEEIGIDGNEFNPVPLTSYEFHTLRIYLVGTSRRFWYFTLYAGETFNRLGIVSPTFGVDVKYSDPCRMDLEFSVYQFPSQVTAGTEALYVTGTATVRF